MLTCKLGEEIINCYDGKYNRETLKKWASKNILKCPSCGKPYEYCHGEIAIPYFRHRDKCECGDKYSEAETQEHIMGKIMLYEWVKTLNGVSNVVLEAWIPETRQRPDIMFEYSGDRYVIEYQCTPIASEYIERQRLYSACGIKAFWILGKDNYMKSGQFKSSRRTIENRCDAYFSPFDSCFTIDAWSQQDILRKQFTDFEYIPKQINAKDIYIDFNKGIVTTSIDYTELQANFRKKATSIIRAMNKNGEMIHFSTAVKKMDKRFYLCPHIDLRINFKHRDLDTSCEWITKSISICEILGKIGFSNQDLDQYGIMYCFNTANNTEIIKCIYDIVNRHYAHKIDYMFSDYWGWLDSRRVFRYKEQ